MRNLLRLGVVFLFCSFLPAQTIPSAPTLLADLDLHNSAVPKSRSSAIPALQPQVRRESFHYVSSRTCAAGIATTNECRVHWTPLLAQASELLFVQQSATLALSPSARNDVSHGSFFPDWFASASGGGHAGSFASQPATSAIAAFLLIQNDPRGRDLAFHNRREYWTSRLRALAFSAAYTAQQDLGPLSRASIENRSTSPATLALAPLAGTAWTVGEDLVDRQLIWRLEGRTSSKSALLAMSLLNPARSAANLIRGRAPWFRDSRETRIAHFELPFHNVPVPAAAGE
jgi:hypothetical protein